MKKIIIIGLVILSNFVFSQKSDNSYIYDESKQPSEIEKSPGEPGDPSVPIDEQIPFLMVAALGMVIVFAKRKKTIDSF
ncbi:hypothetical protein ACN9MN_07500 [Chryseobacterium sp. S-02]|uniref:hypothetical protein n=1 Tax=Chryseobacterium sp. S-02 TaxID=3404064 RepID=UPI003CF7AE0A